jgi:membrane protein YqaA with SNARE-associated domain
VRDFISRIYGFALGLGGPGLFVVAFLDSSFISLPQINDLLVVLMVTRNKAWMPYYATLATLGSVAGCYVIYRLAEKGGEAFLRKRLKAGHIERALAMYKKHGLLALIVPGLLPPPAPFKLFVLAAGLADVKASRFVLGVAVSRGVRYFALGLLSVYYGDAAMELMRTRGRDVALGLVALIVVVAVAFWLVQRRRSKPALPEMDRR